MSEQQGHSNRGRGGGRGGGRGHSEHRGGRGGGGGGGRGGHNAQQQERPKKENILDLGKYMDKRITVKFNGGREGKQNPSTFWRNVGHVNPPLIPPRESGAKRGAVGAIILTDTIVTGSLKGYDALMNLVLDDVQEVLRGTAILAFGALHDLLLIPIR